MRNVCNTCQGEGIINPHNDINTTILCQACDGSGRVEDEVVEDEVVEELSTSLDKLRILVDELTELEQMKENMIRLLDQPGA